MAKVGNEVKLVLRLAEELAAAGYDAYENQNTPDFSDGFQHGIRLYQAFLADVISDLERK